MRKHVLTALTLLPLLLTVSHASQRYSVEPGDMFGISSDDTHGASYLGVDIADVTKDRLETLKLKEEHGVEVTMVDQDAPAGKAGLKEHDVILAMNGTPVESEAQLKRMIHETPAGRTVTLNVSRDGQPMTVKVQLAERNKAWLAPKAKDFHIEIPPIPNLPDFDMPMNVVVVHSSARSGLMVENLTPQLGDFFGVKSGNGVLIRSVEKNSRAEKAGFRAGDVIIRLGDQTVHDTSDFSHALKPRSGGSVNVTVIRDKKEQTLTLTLPERKESGDMIFEEESSDAPMIGADSYYIDLSKMEDEIARMRPQMELAAQQAKKAAKEIQKSYCDQEKRIREQTEKLRKEITPRVQKQLQTEQDEMRKYMLELQHEMQGNELDL